MSTISNSQINELKSKFDTLLSFKDENEEFEHEALMLMSGFLSEIEAVQKRYNVNRKELAKKIGTSPSYLTQVFRNDKPLNFYTLAKINKALNIRFDIRAVYLNETFTLKDSQTFIPFSPMTFSDNSFIHIEPKMSLG